ncbi:MAG: flagellar hook capping FlgD N-terminal domain-containing protein [Terracidiphilus sp.]|jgi:flagellar basal-body rod modification protein FlgD
MATAAGLFSHQMTAGQVLTHNTATPMDSSTSGTSGTSSSDDSSDSSTTISANDFLTLLVTEMQNQDPTADTDPNEYINQLVNVNSLEQLIDINQTLSTDLGSTSGNGTSTQATEAASGSTNAATPAFAATSLRTTAHAAASPLSAMSGVSTSNSSTISTQRISDNLSVPNANPAAERVGHALAGRTHATSLEGTLPATQ